MAHLSHSSYAYILGNPDLQPETSLNFDFSLEAEKGRTSGKIGYFRNKVKNLIDYEYIGTTSGLYTYRYYNVNKAAIQGIEAEATQKLGDKFSLKAGYAFPVRHEIYILSNFYRTKHLWQVLCFVYNYFCAVYNVRSVAFQASRTVFCIILRGEQ